MTVLVNSHIRNGATLRLGGALAGAGSYVTWTGTVTDVIAPDGGAPYTGDYDDYFGTIAAVAGLFSPTTWSNAALTALGVPYNSVGLGNFAGTLNTTCVDTIAYTFSSPVPAGASFTLVDPGAGYGGWTGVETYAVSATYLGAAVSTSGWRFQIMTPTGVAAASNISINAASGVITVSSYVGQTWPASLVVITPNTPVSSIQVVANTIPYDFWSFNLPHLPSALLFQMVNVASPVAGMIASWQINGVAIQGGGSIGNPGSAWAYMGNADLGGTGYTDILFRNQSGMYAFWAVSGSSIVIGGNIANPGGTWSLAGLADFDADGRDDMVFQDMTGNLFLWQMNTSAIVGGGSLGNPGPGWRLLSVGDFGGAGAGLLFQNANGVYAEWQLSGTRITSALTLGAPASGWAYAGTADLTGEGTSEVLFRNPATGQYGAWFLSATGVSSFSVIATPGVYETLVAVGTFTASAAQGLIFENTATGVLSDYQFAGGVLSTTGAIADPGTVWAVERPPYGGFVPPPPTIFFTDPAGDIATWAVPQSVFTSGAVYGNAKSGWSFLAGADFYGLAQPDILLANASGQLAIWRTNGAQIVANTTIGAPGGTKTYAGVGDFNADGLSDILFRDASGNYTAWLMDGAAIIGGGASLGNPGADYALVGVGDLTGDGTSDLVFEAPNGLFVAEFVRNGAYAGSTPIGGAGPGWSVAGMGDFNGDGREDILLANTNGMFATWDMNGAAVVGGGQFQGPGAGWACMGVETLFANRDASVIFRNASSGALFAYNMNDGVVQSITSLGTPGGGYGAAGLL